MSETTALHPGFGEATRTWFARAFAAPTLVQEQAWEAIASGDDTLVVSPTGSGKTLAAFLWALDRLVAEPGRGCRVLYISPLRALASDVERNLRAPLAGIERLAKDLGQQPHPVRTAIRTADTPQAERQRMARTPPDILITTPESLFLLLTSRAGAFLKDVETVIVDEIHSVAGSKRGAHLSLSLERLDLLTEQPAQRIGLSATVTPVDTVAHFLHAGHDVRIVNPGLHKPVELTLNVPLPDMTAFDEPVEDGQPRRASIWPAVEQSILNLIEQHTSTIVFTNSRRVCERLSSRLNELAADESPDDEIPAVVMAQAGIAGGSDHVVARAHHGSVSKSERALIEDDLKSGRLPAVVATSSLELGIDMGSIDLMVQVGCPPSVASGLQRLGRAGHRLDAVSKGVFFPTHRGDLLATAVALEGMRDQRIEPTRIPRHPLDVLSQQIVAMVAMQDWHVDELFDVITRASGYTTLPRSAYDAVLDMLSGRYPSDDFAQLRPRVVWDRTTDVLTARAGAQRTAVISGGTIPDRGLFPVFIVGTKDGRVGELDEEMVYESRVGDVISLGASSWRIEEITFDRVLVTPAPGRPGKLPFWHADAQGRSAEMGRAIGEFLRRAESGQTAEGTLDAFARENLATYLSEQIAATSVLPTDRRVLVERFRDEIGDWRLVVHAPWGARVTAPWALLAGARIREAFGLDPNIMATDDGLVMRLLDTDQDEAWWDAVIDALLLDPDDLVADLSREITSSALFAAKFRECSSRALLLTRNAPGKRTPLWQQRQRSAQLLAVAGTYPGFPMVLEAVRECLDDVYDLPALREVLRGVRDGLITVDVVQTDTPSPMAQTQMFSYVSVFMYEADSPLGQQAAALELDHALLADLLSDTDLRSIIPQEAIDQVEEELQWRQPDRIRSADDLADLLRAVGFQSEAQRDLPFAEELVAARRAFRVRVAGREVLAAVEDMPRLRDALGVVLPPEVPFAFTEPVADPVGDLLGRFARTHGPFTTADAASHLGLGTRLVEELLQHRKSAGLIRWGRFSAAAEHGQWIDPEVLQRIRRRAAALLRGAQEPVPVHRLCAFLPRWQKVTSPGSLTAALGRLAGYVAAASVWEQDLLPVRVAGYQTHHLDQLTAAGDVVWSGAGRLGARDALVSFVPAGLEDLLPAADTEDLSEAEQAVWDVVRHGGGWFARDLTMRLPDLGQDTLEAAVWGLVWRGMLTNDSLAALRDLRRPGGRVRSRRAARSQLPGRWSAVVRPGRPDAPLVWAQTLLDRYGVLDRNAVGNERVPGGFHALFGVLRRLDDAGRCQQVYAVEGLGGAQFALRPALEQLRQERAPEPVLLAATDPANPLGISMPWPEGGRPVRKAGALVFLGAEGPLFYLDAAGRSLLSWTDDPDLTSAFVTALRGRRSRVSIRRINGGEVFAAATEPFVAAGLRLTPSGLR